MAIFAVTPEGKNGKNQGFYGGLMEFNDLIIV
jgi:hypothetical protein